MQSAAQGQGTELTCDEGEARRPQVPSIPDQRHSTAEVMCQWHEASTFSLSLQKRTCLLIQVSPGGPRPDRWCSRSPRAQGRDARPLLPPHPSAGRLPRHAGGRLWLCRGTGRAVKAPLSPERIPSSGRLLETRIGAVCMGDAGKSGRWGRCGEARRHRVTHAPVSGCLLPSAEAHRAMPSEQLPLHCHRGHSLATCTTRRGWPLPSSTGSTGQATGTADDQQALPRGCSPGLLLAPWTPNETHPETGFLEHEHQI